MVLKDNVCDSEYDSDFHYDILWPFIMNVMQQI